VSASTRWNFSLRLAESPRTTKLGCSGGISIPTAAATRRPGGDFAGDSIGHWEGATLVVDTIGIKESVALGMGMKHSDKLHLTERIHLDKADPDTLVDELTAEDPVALAKPWMHSFTYKRSRDWTLLEFICAENDRNPVDASGDTGFKKE